MLKIVELSQLKELKAGDKKIVLHFITEYQIDIFRWCNPCRLTKKMLESDLAVSSSFAWFIEVNCD